MINKKYLNSILYILAGILLTFLVLVVYTRVITPSLDAGEKQSIPPLELIDKDVFITAITGEVFIIRNENIQMALIGDALYEGDVLKVVDQSYCQIQFADRGSAGLDSNTVMLMKKLVNADNLKIRTEVLMGSMMYRVKKLNDNDDFQVESEGVVYDIKGTEFLVVNSLEGFLLAVKEGEVSTTSLSHGVKDLSVRGGEEVYLSKDLMESPQVIPMGESASKRIDKLEGIKILQNLGNPSMLTVLVNPPGSEIYIDGRKSGTGNFTGLFEEGTQLKLLARKQGYQDKTVLHTVKANTSEEIKIQLIPSGLADTLDNNFLPMETILENKISQQEEELNILKENYEKDKENNFLIESQYGILEKENQILEDEISKKNEEIEQLKELMIQIRDLSEQN